MAAPNRTRIVAAGVVLVALGLLAFVTAPMNNPLEGWGLLLRALAGEALVVAGIECVTRARRARGARNVRLTTMVVLSVLLAPPTGCLVLMTKESGPSWSMASLLLFVWFVVSGAVAAFVPDKASRSGRDE